MLKLELCKRNLIYASQNKHIWDISDEYVLVEYLSKTQEPDVYNILRENQIATLYCSIPTPQTLVLERFGDNLKWRTYLNKSHCDLFGSLGEWFKALHAIEHLRDTSELTDVGALAILKPNVSTNWMRKYVGYSDWRKIERSFPIIYQRVCKIPRCILHNDFCYKNVVVNHQEKTCIMYDYDKAGYGFAALDVRSILERTTPHEYEMFIEGYGTPDPTEMKMAELVDSIEILKTAALYSSLPNWSKDAIWALHTGKLYALIEELC